MAAISTIIIKSLYAKSGNMCAFPGCEEKLTQSGFNLSEIAHIISGKPNGPRHDPNYNNGNYDVDENLMLLCPKHHKLVDRHIEQYPVNVMRDMKNSHEKYNESLLGINDVNQRIINQFLTLIHQYEVIMIVQMNDFLSPIYFAYLDKLNCCNMEIDGIIYSLDTIYCNGQIVQDINNFKQTLEDLTEYLLGKGYVNENSVFIPFFEKIDESYILNLRSNLINIYKKYTFNNQ